MKRGPPADARFEELRKAYAAARRDSEALRSRLVQANEAAKRLSREIGAASRRTATEGPARARLDPLKEQLAKLRQDADELKRSLAQSERAKLAALDRFAPFTDPMKGVGQLPDDTPIALFPLRLETRYRTTPRAGGPPRRQLCVRVFPDDILVDTFQPEISEAELENVTRYWTHRWRARGDPAGHRAAWAALARASGAGRARWLLDQVAPLHPAHEPAAGPGPVLVILPPTPVPEGEKAAIASFWQRVWSTQGAQRDAAFADLVAALGPSRADEVEADLAPANLHDPAVKPDPSLAPVVAFLDLPARDGLPMSQDAWTRGARAWLMPERLVLLGFQGRDLALRRVGEPIPPSLQIGPDPSADPADQIRASGPDLEVPEALRWTVDFEEAVAKGMGFAIDLEEGQPLPRFDRLFVLGVRVGSDADDGAAELTELIQHHQASRKGLSLLPQGRATNNTDGTNAGYTWWEDPEETYRHFFQPDPHDDPDDWRRRKDGAWLAGILGIDRTVLRRSPHYHGTDQAEARAMNAALWPATLGYYMEQMMEPVFSEATVQETRSFFPRFVLGRGTIPLIRVGRQPYGILPTTAWSRMGWWKDAPYEGAGRPDGLPDPGYLDSLFALTQRAAGLWNELSQEVPRAGSTTPDPHQALLRTVALHPTSVEFHQRYARSFAHYYNALQFAGGSVSETVAAAARRYVEAGLTALDELGWEPEANAELPEILEKIFLERANLLQGPLVQTEVSDHEPLAVARADGLNYVAWLQSAAQSSHNALRRQDGFVGGAPRALLYQMLRHALDLGFVDAALAFRRMALRWNDATYKAERREPKSIHVAEGVGKSRWEDLYLANPTITGDPTLRMAEYIPSVLQTRDPYLATQVAALDVLKVATSGALERAFVEHLDCLTYRLDAWRMGLVAVQLSQMRHESANGFAKRGVYVGAYGWLEDVAPNERALAPVELDGELAQTFPPAGAPPLVRDPANYGHIHAPSQDQAVAAAILRNGHLANATPQAPDLLAVDLGSERVRLALQVIEGIANGQSLGALLGYRLERALHDEPGLFLDRLIHDLRRAFPLAGNRNARTKVAPLQDISKVEARNVVDAAAFLDHLAQTGETTYPYGVDGLPPLSGFVRAGTPSAAQIGAIVDRHVAHVRSIADAVSDLQIAEGVYQVVKGNYDRASAALDAFSKGTHPPVPEVVATPRKGRTLTHRVGLHLEAGLPPADPAHRTPRARGEPALARWLERQLPDPAQVFARVTWTEGAGRASLTPSMADLGLAAVDLFYMLDAGSTSDTPGFDDLLIDFAQRNGAPAPRHDAVFDLEYKPVGVAGLTLFEIAPLARALRGLVLGARPLRSSDLSPQNEASARHDVHLLVRVDKVQTVLAELGATLPAVQAFLAALDAGLAGDAATARDAARDNVDAWMADHDAILRPVAPFGLRAGSLTTAVEGRRAPFAAMLAAIDAAIGRWQEKRDGYDEVLQAYAALPGGATDAERTALLVRAGRIVSTTIIAPLPPTPAALQAQVAALRLDFDQKLADLLALRAGARTVGATLAALTAFMPAYLTIDRTPLDLGPFRDSALALAHDLRQKAEDLRDDIGRRIAEASAALARAAAARGEKAQAEAAAAAKAVLGEAFVLLPEFRLGPEPLAEWDNAWRDRAATRAHLARPFPLDDWLIGVARVRERMRHVESAIHLAEALGSAGAPILDAIQLPYKPNDAWVGLEFPATFPDGTPFEVDEDKLLYSAHFATNAELVPADPNRTYTGILIDEWVEVVPVDEVVTGLAFHFDRPNSEAPQAILLATPPRHQGAWRWEDLVATLHETLDLARQRAVEPEQLDRTALGPLLPALISAVTLHPITAALNFSVVNDVEPTLPGGRQ